MLDEIMIFLGILCTAYFLGIWLYAGLSSKFPVIWLAAGLCFFAAAAGLRMGIHLPAGLRILVCAGAGIFLLIFLITEILIVQAMFHKPEPGMDYLVVLGAQVKGKRPSQSLQYRIDEAYEYLKENPGARAVLSGGQGDGEAISEAQCMYEYLIQKGIHPSRLIKEEQSVNTTQNIEFSWKLIEEEQEKNTDSFCVGIVTNSFHVYRGTAIARKKMNCMVQEVPAKSNAFLQINYMVREGLGVLKDKAAGNL